MPENRLRDNLSHYLNTRSQISSVELFKISFVPRCIMIVVGARFLYMRLVSRPVNPAHRAPESPSKQCGRHHVIGRHPSPHLPQWNPRKPMLPCLILKNSIQTKKRNKNQQCVSTIHMYNTYIHKHVLIFCLFDGSVYCHHFCLVSV